MSGIVHIHVLALCVLTLASALQAADNMVEKSVELAFDEVEEGHKKNFRKILDNLGKRAVPVLIDYVRQDKSYNKRIYALMGLNVCWDDRAVEPLFELIQDRRAPDDPKKMAFLLLTSHVAPAELAPKLNRIMTGLQTQSYHRVLEYLETYDPNLKRVKKHLLIERFWPYLCKSLARYHSPELQDEIQQMLLSGGNEEKRAAIIASLYRLDRSGKTQSIIKRELQSDDPDLREAAGEYFTWLGSKGDLKALTSAYNAEKDLHTRACLKTAIEMIVGREKNKTAIRIPQFLLDKLKSSPDFAATVKLLEDVNAGKATKQGVADYLQTNLDVSPFYKFPGNPENREQQLIRYFVRFYLRSYLLEADTAQANTKKGAPPERAASFVPPVRNYFNSKRHHYGKTMKADPDHPPVQPNYHVGDKTAFWQPGRTIVSTANGIVKEVSYNPSVGHYVIIEHTLKNGKKLCSVYYHLSGFVCVRPGQVVAAGDKIGTVGQGFSYENGGAPSHFHFALYRAEYGDGDWMTAYLPQADFKSRKNRWTDPQRFLRKKVDDIAKYQTPTEEAEDEGLSTTVVELSQPELDKRKGKTSSNFYFGTTRYYPVNWTKPRIITNGKSTIISGPTPIFRGPTKTGVLFGD